MLVVLVVALMLLLVQPDFGSAALISAVCFGMWFVGGVPMRHLLLMLSSFLPVALVVLVAEPYRLKRLTSFLDPWGDPYNSGYQLIQSMIAFGSGGLFGTGLGQGVQKLFYLPEVFTDFISASIGEELGLMGILTLIAIFSLMLGRGIWMAIRHQDMFEKLLVLGCVMILGVAFIINLGAAMGLLPTKGMPMPFVSYGGSALLGECVLMGLILSVQRHQGVAPKPKKGRKKLRRAGRSQKKEVEA